MRVAILGWARLSKQAHEGSGYNLSASELASGLVMSGHEVFYLRSGLDYSPLPGPRTRLFETWRGIECHDFLNSRNVSPASSNFRNMELEISSPGDNSVVLRWLDAVGAQIVHVHSLEGFALDLIAAIRGSGRPVVVTTHNYWFGCPQVDLVRDSRHLCRDYESGTACEGCIEAPKPESVRRKRAIEQTAQRLFGSALAGAGKLLFKHYKKKLKQIGKRPDGPFTGHDIKPDPEMAVGFDVKADPSHDGEIHLGFALDVDEQPIEVEALGADENERFLGDDCHLKVLNNNLYGRRRRAGIAALNASSLVTPPSRFVLSVMESMGLDPARGRVVRLGQPHFDQINRRVRRSVYYDRRPWDASDPDRPLRIAFFGVTRQHKGLEIFVRSIELLDKDVRRRCHFTVRAFGWDWPFRKRLSRFPEVSFLGPYQSLHLLGAPGEYDVGVLPHIWFENSPLVLLERLHAGKFVLCSRLGGPVEWVREPDGGSLGNGLMFPGADPAALAAQIGRLASGEVTVPSAREVHAVTPLRSYPDHVLEVQAMYRELLDGPPEPTLVKTAGALAERAPA